LLLAAAPTPVSASRSLIVQFESEGDHALGACAETLFREQRAFAEATADASDSLDRIHRRVPVLRMRALFRRPDGRPLAEQRAVLRQRLAPRRPPRSAAVRPTAGEGPAPDLSHVYVVETAEDASAEQLRALYAADPHVAWVQIDHAHELDALPNDPFLSSSGSWGQAFEDLWGLHRIRAPEAWSLSRGEGVVVAVVDTGLDYDHPDIADNVFVHPGEDLDGNGRVDPSDWNGVDDDGNGFVDDLRGWNFASDAGSPDPFDDAGHGTHVAGTIAAVADNGVGIAGVAPGSRIMPLKGFPADGPGLDSVLWRAVLYAAENGADVVNASWSCSEGCASNPLAEEVVRIVHGLGVVIVTSAGNRQRDVSAYSPESMRETLTVASSGQDDRLSAGFSNFGWSVDLVAPGGDPADDRNVYVARRNILSLRSSADEASAPFAVGGDYFRSAGTSMAAPHVSGVVALLRGRQPGLDYESIRRILRRSAVDLGPPGHDRLHGAGRLDAWAALQHGPLPDLLAVLTSPRPGAALQPQAGPVEIRGSAAGEDLQGFEVSYGVGADPEAWLPIPTVGIGPVRDDVLARWDVRGLEQGAYVVKLEVRARSGEVFSEFLPIALEGGRHSPISSPGQSAGRPAVSQRLVAWQSRRGVGAFAAAGEGLDLFVDDLATATEHVLSAAPGDQHSVSLAQGVASWLDEGQGSVATEILGCRFDRRTGLCPASRVPAAGRVSLPPASASGQIFWLDERTGMPDLYGCRPRRHGVGCDEFAVGVAPARRLFLRSDGRSLVWIETVGGWHFASCRVSPRTGRCSAEHVAEAILPLSEPTASGRLFAWVGFDLTGAGPLQICELDSETGACEPVHVADGVIDARPDLSGSRLVWHARVGSEASDVFFCEFDARTRSCPVQRLTADIHAQQEAAIDGDRIVWEDEREGPARIDGTRLPSLAPLRDRRLEAGRPLRVAVRGRDPLGGRLQLEAAVVGAPSLESLGARFEASDDGRGRLRWRPAPEHVGPWIFTFSARSEAGLVARRSLLVEVTPARLTAGAE